ATCALASGTVMSWNIVGGSLPKRNITFPSTVNTVNTNITIESYFVYSWLLRLNHIGASVGIMSAVFIAQIIGRKHSISILCFLFLLSWILKLVGDMDNLITAMILGGICIGSASAVVPMYLCELAVDKFRGSTGSLYFAMFTLGRLITEATTKASYIWYTSIPLFFPPLFFITVFLAPESPPYLIYKEKTTEAKISLLRLRDGDVSAEFIGMAEEIQPSIKRFAIKDIVVKTSTRKGVLFSFTTMMFLALCGASQIQSLISDFYGFHNYYILNLINLSIQIVFSVAAGRLSDIIGRKKLLIFSALTMSSSLIVFGIYYRLGNRIKYWILPKVFIFVFIIGYSSGFGPLSWIIVMELIPINVKYVGCILTISSYWLVELLFHDVFVDNMEECVGKDVFMWIVAGICVLAATFVFFLLPETIKLNIKERRESLHKKKAATTE
ncbi:hypothetical protein L9F63_023374, partial [Diploptera punctata]